MPISPHSVIRRPYSLSEVLQSSWMHKRPFEGFLYVWQRNFSLHLIWAWIWTCLRYIDQLMNVNKAILICAREIVGVPFSQSLSKYVRGWSCSCISICVGTALCCEWILQSGVCWRWKSVLLERELSWRWKSVLLERELSEERTRLVELGISITDLWNFFFNLFFCTLIDPY